MILFTSVAKVTDENGIPIQMRCSSYLLSSWHCNERSPDDVRESCNSYCLCASVWAPADIFRILKSHFGGRRLWEPRHILQFCMKLLVVHEIKLYSYQLVVDFSTKLRTFKIYKYF